MLRVVLLSIFCISAVWAHKINLFAYDENNTLYLQSYFTKSSPCKQCPIKLLGSNEQELGTLMSDDEGKASMKLPAAAFSIVVDGGMGHQQKIEYRAQSHTKEEAKQLPSDTPLDKIALALGILVFFFGALYWIKRRKQTL